MIVAIIIISLMLMIMIVTAALGKRGRWARDRAKDAGYSAIVVVGYSILAAIVYNLYRLHLLLLLLPVNNLMLRNLFSSDGTTVMYSKAVADCLANEKLTKILGKPVKTFGESIIKMSSL